MTNDNVQAAVLEVLARIAPEADLSNIEPDVTFHEQFDIDSLDFVNFVAGLGNTLQMDIPEEDYYRLATLNGCIAYLAP